mgnify:FL=1
MRIIYLISGLILSTLTISAEEITTNNLISQDFTDGSWNNPVNSWHSSNDLAGWNGLEHTTEVTYTPETEALKLNGFNMTAGGEIFHWYNGQKVHVNQSVTLDNGTVFEQTKTYEASRGTVHDVANTIVISSNTSDSYDLGMGILFEDNRGLDGHRSADFRDPYITLTYDDTVFQLDEVVEQELTDLFTEFKPEQDLKLEETFKVVELFNEPIEMKEELKIEEFIEIVSMPEKEPKVIEEMPNAIEEVVEEKPEEEVITEEIMQEAKEEMPKEVVEQEEEIKEQPKEEIIEEEKQEVATEPKEEEPKEEVAEEESKEEVKTKVATKTNKKPKIDKIMAKVDAQVKDHAKNLAIKNIIKLDAMQNDQASLLEYNNTEFYKPKDIYLNQIEIFDNRSIYKNVDLVQYIDNDIMEIKIKKLNEIKYKKRILLLELKELKNG